MAETPSIDTTLIDRAARRLGLTDAKRPLSARIERHARLVVLGDVPETPLPVDPETTLVVDASRDGEPSAETIAQADAILLLRVAPPEDIPEEERGDPLRRWLTDGPAADRLHVLDPTVDGSESAFRAVVETAERRARARRDHAIAEGARAMVEEIVPLVTSRLRGRRRLLILCDLLWILALTGGLVGAVKVGGAGSGDALHAFLLLLLKPVMGVPVAGGLAVAAAWLVLVVLGHFWFASWTGGLATRRTSDAIGPLGLDARTAVRRSVGFFRPPFSATPVGWTHTVERRLRKLVRDAS